MANLSKLYELQEIHADNIRELFNAQAGLIFNMEKMDNVQRYNDTIKVIIYQSNENEKYEKKRLDNLEEMRKLQELIDFANERVSNARLQCKNSIRDIYKFYITCDESTEPVIIDTDEAANLF